MPILIDIGNSFIKLSSSQKNSLIYQVKLDLKNQNNVKNEINAVIEKITTNSPNKLMICSVNLEWNNILKPLFDSYDPIWITLDHFSNLNFNHIQEIGLDLLSLGNGLTGNNNTLIISFGTATTFSLWNKKVLIGVNISLGPWNAYHLLLKKASLINTKLNFMQPKLNILGSNTADAVAIGAFKGHALMVEAMIVKIKATYQVDDVILTGGGLDNIINNLENSYKINKHLLFEGMSKIKK